MTFTFNLNELLVNSYRHLMGENETTIINFFSNEFKSAFSQKKTLKNYELLVSIEGENLKIETYSKQDFKLLQSTKKYHKALQYTRNKAYKDAEKLLLALQKTNSKCEDYQTLINFIHENEASENK